MMVKHDVSALVLDTSLGYVYVLTVFVVAAIVVTGIFSSGDLQRKSPK